MKRGLAALALCLLVGLSGCSTLFGADGATADPPGVGNGTLEDPEALLDAHVDALTTSGYSHVLHLNQSRVVDGGVVNVTREQRTSVAAGASEYRFQLVTDGPQSSRLTVWANETTAFRRFEAGGNEPRYGTGPAADGSDLTGVNFVEPHLSAPFEVAGTTTAGGEPLVTLESTGRPTGAGVLPPNAQSVSGYDARAVVDSTGRIHRFEASATYTVDGRSTSFEVSFEVTSFEAPDIERPSWVDSIRQSG